MSVALTAHLADMAHELDRLEPIVTDLQQGIGMRDAALHLRRVVGQMASAIDKALIDFTADEADEDGRRRIMTSDGVFIVGPKPERKACDWPLLLPTIAARIVDDRLVDFETGEVHDDEPVTEKFVRLLPSVVPMTASVMPKAAGMKALGLDRGRYVSSEPGALEVRVER